MRTRAPLFRPAALLVSTALLLSACGSGGGSSDGGGSDGAADGGGASGGTFSMYIGDPENPLVPGNTTESEGSQVIESLFTGLIEYSADGQVEYTGVAESVESPDNTTWTVTLKDGWTFHDGTPVTAQSFVDAWNYTALSSNAQNASYFFSNVVGYDQLQAQTDDAGNVTAEPAGQEMSGLTVVDDKTFTVELSAPFAQFPTTLGYNAFFPLPKSFFADPKAGGELPVGNGPFKADAAYAPGQGITLTRYDDFGGDAVAKADSVEYRVYTDINTAYTDVQAGNLDVLKDLPPDTLTTVKDEFGDRFQEAPSSSFTYLAFPLYDARFEDKRVRQAISMAIDRQAIADAIFNGARIPADAAVAPVVDGYRKGACTYCVLDPAAANALLDEAGFDRSQPVELWFNAGAGHDAWMEAVGNQLRENLGVEFTLKGDLDFAEYLPLGASKGYTGPFRRGWSMDYPSPVNYLEPLYSTSALPPAGDNDTFYSNPAFDTLIDQGNAAASNDEAISLYNQAEDLLLEDMPIAPMFFQLEQSVHSEKVSDVASDVFGQVDAAAVTVTG